MRRQLAPWLRHLLLATCPDLRTMGPGPARAPGGAPLQAGRLGRRCGCAGSEGVFSSPALIGDRLINQSSHQAVLGFLLNGEMQWQRGPW